MMFCGCCDHELLYGPSYTATLAKTRSPARIETDTLIPPGSKSYVKYSPIDYEPDPIYDSHPPDTTPPPSPDTSYHHSPDTSYPSSPDTTPPSPDTSYHHSPDTSYPSSPDTSYHHSPGTIYGASHDYLDIDNPRNTDDTDESWEMTPDTNASLFGEDIYNNIKYV